MSEAHGEVTIRSPVGGRYSRDASCSASSRSFRLTGRTPHKRDLPKVEFDLLDTGHFALEDKLDEMAALIRDFLNRRVGERQRDLEVCALDTPFELRV